MSDNVFAFPGNKTSNSMGDVTNVADFRSCRSAGRPYIRRGKTMHNLVFRSRKGILEADETLLFEDVCYDLDKAVRKLEAARLQLEKVQEHAGAEIRDLT